MKSILSNSELLELVQKHLNNELTKILIEFRELKIEKVTAIKKAQSITGCNLFEARSFIEIASSVDIIHISPLIHKHGIDAYKYI